MKWTRLVFFAHRDCVSAWRGEEETGGAVLFLASNGDLRAVVEAMRLQGRLIGADAARHDEMCRFLGALGLETMAEPFTAMEPAEEPPDVQLQELKS